MRYIIACIVLCIVVAACAAGEPYCIKVTPHGINSIDCVGWYGRVAATGFGKPLTLFPVENWDGSTSWVGSDELGTASHTYPDGTVIREEGVYVQVYNANDYVWIDALSSGYMVSFFSGAGCTNNWSSTVLLNENDPNGGCTFSRYSASGGSVELTFYDYDSALAEGLLPVRNFTDLPSDTSTLDKMKLFCVGWLLPPKTFDPNE
jgi:hypothetical protein